MRDHSIPRSDRVEERQSPRGLPPFYRSRLRRYGVPIAACFFFCVLIAGCTRSGGEASHSPKPTAASTSIQSPSASTQGVSAITWQADEQPSTVYYEIFVRSFYDSNGDGIGDLNGVTEKLDYLQELGVGGIWLMPINASPSYHGYDVTDYYGVNPDYGTLDDLKRLIAEAHKRKIKVIMDLVLNHTSSEHPWFKQALTNPSSPYRNWYTFKKSDEQVSGDSAAGNGSPWHLAGAYKYLGIFSEAMPDLNFDEPAVRAELIKVGQYWLTQGMDGFRLDAVKHIYGDFNATVHSSEVAQKNLTWWQEFRKGIAEANPNVYLVGEVWDSPSMISPLLDHALDSGFNFDVGKRILSAAEGEQDPDLAFTLKRIYGAFEKSSGGTFVDAPFLTNHDQDRSFSVLGNNVEHAKMAAAILLTMPGNPFIYYGEELGMRGMKPDESIREPMSWYEAASGGKGQTTWEPIKYNKEGTASVEAEDQDGQSLLNHYRMLTKWREEEPALRDGSIDSYAVDNPQIGAYIRMTRTERDLVVHNMSGKSQSVALAVSKVYGAFTKIALASGAEGFSLSEDGKLVLPPYSTAILK